MARVRTQNPETLLSAVTITGAGESVTENMGDRGSGDFTFEAFLSDTTTPAATVVVEVGHTPLCGVVLGTITLTGAGARDGFMSYSSGWKYIRGNVTAISGTAAAVTLTMGV